MAKPQPQPEIPGYQLVKQIGSGGMATVFLAVQLSLERRVAIKVLRTVADDDPDRTEKRFLREGRTLAKITHKNVCGIYDIAKVGNIAYIAMEYLDGGTLVDKLRQGVSVSEAISTVVQIASALEEAHKLGIIHRDLKPANVMLRAGRVPVLTDFGIARELTSSHTRITAENMIVGTPIYMSPEQVSGGEVDGRSDLYALGIMFFELLTGQPPYRGDTPIAVCMQHLTAALPALPEDLADLQPVLDRMLAKKREERYADMLVFTHALRDVFVGSEALRHVLRFSPDMPWSEQLRDLGFSFDTLRDADVKAALEAQRGRLGPATGKTAKAKQPPPQPKPRMAYSQGDEPVEARIPARRGPPRALLTTIAVLVLIVGAAGIWWWQKQPRVIGHSELMALSLLQNEFGERIEGGKLFDPPSDNALHFANEMRKIAPESDYTTLAFSQLAAAAVSRAEEALQSGDMASFDAGLAALRKALPTAPEIADLSARRDALIAAQNAELALRKRLARLAELTAGAAPASGESVLGLYLDLRGALSKDPQFIALEPKALKAARTRVDAALAAGERLSALADARALSSVQPTDASLASLVRELEARVNAEQQTAAAALKADNEAKRRGMLAIGAAPWGRVDDIVDAAGKRFALPPDPSTPLLLTLPAGQYRVSLTAGQGSTRRQESVEVKPGGLASLNIQFSGYGSDDYLKEIGW